MPRSLYDLLPDEVKAQYPPEALDAPAARILLRPGRVPDDYDSARATEAGRLLTLLLPRMTQMRAATNRVRAGMRGELEQPTLRAPTMAERDMGTMERLQRGVMPASTAPAKPSWADRDASAEERAARGMFGVQPAEAVETATQRLYRTMKPGRIPLGTQRGRELGLTREISKEAQQNLVRAAVAAAPNLTGLLPKDAPENLRWSKSDILPAARRPDEHVADVAGGLAGFVMRQMVAARLLGAAGGVLTAFPKVTGPMTAGLAMATDTERPEDAGLSFGLGTAFAAASHGLAGKIMGKRPSVPRAIAAQAPPALAFGYGQPWAHAYSLRAMGEKDHPLPSFKEGAQGVAEMAIINALLGGKGIADVGRMRAHERRQLAFMARRLAPPPGLRVADAAASRRMSARLTEVLGGKDVIVNLPDGTRGAARVVGVVAYQMPEGGERINLLVRDPSNAMTVLQFKGTDDLVGSLEGPQRLGMPTGPVSAETQPAIEEALAKRELGRKGPVGDESTSGTVLQRAGRLAEVEAKLKGLEKHRPKQSDKGYRRWVQRVERLTAERDALRASVKPLPAPGPAPVAGKPVGAGPGARTPERAPGTAPVEPAEREIDPDADPDVAPPPPQMKSVTERFMGKRGTIPGIGGGGTEVVGVSLTNDGVLLKVRDAKGKTHIVPAADFTPDPTEAPPTAAAPKPKAPAAPKPKRTGGMTDEPLKGQATPKAWSAMLRRIGIDSFNVKDARHSIEQMGDAIYHNAKQYNEFKETVLRDLAERPRALKEARDVFDVIERSALEGERDEIPGKTGLIPESAKWGYRAYHGSANLARGGFSGELRTDITPSGNPRGGRGIDALGVWFTNSKADAEWYSRHVPSGGKDAVPGAVVTADVKYDNAKMFDSPDAYWKWATEMSKKHTLGGPGAGQPVAADAAAIRAELKKDGYDAIVVLEGGTSDKSPMGASWLILLDPKAATIKSVEGAKEAPKPKGKPEPKPAPPPKEPEKPKVRLKPKEEPKAAEPEGGPIDPAGMPREFAGSYTIDAMMRNLKAQKGRDGLLRRSPDGKVWTDGHVMLFMDALERPADAGKFGPIASGKEGGEYPRYEQVIPDKVGAKLDPVALVGRAGQTGAGGPVLWLADAEGNRVSVNARYYNAFHELMGDNIEFYANAEKPLGAITVKKGGKIAGLLMPVTAEAGEMNIPGLRAGAAARLAGVGEEYRKAVRSAVDAGRLDGPGIIVVEKLLKDRQITKPGELNTFLKLFQEPPTAATLVKAWEKLAAPVRAIELAKETARKKDRSALDEEFIARAKQAEKSLAKLAKYHNIAKMAMEDSFPDPIMRYVGLEESGENAAMPAGAAARPTGPKRTARTMGMGTASDIPAATRQPSLPPPGGPPLPMASVPQPPPGVGPKKRGRLGKALDAIKSTAESIVKGAYPLAFVDRRAQDIFYRVRGQSFERAVWRTHRAQKLLERFWRTQKPEVVFRFLDDFEGRPATSPGGVADLSGMDPRLRDIAMSYVERGERMFRGVSHYAEIPWWENWFPHMWKDPKAAAEFFAARRPMEGTKSFKKRRLWSSIREGIEKGGLEPVSTNPEVLMQLAEHNARKFIFAQRLLAEYKRSGHMVFGRPGEKPGGKRIPKGYRTLDQRWSKVYLNPEIPVEEYFDKQLHDTLQKVRRSIGATAERKMHLKGKALGWSLSRPGQAGHIQTKFGTPLSVLSHEIGHAIDAKYGLRNAFLSINGPKGVEIRKELRALADLRIEGIQNLVSGNFKHYIRSGPEKMAVMLEALAYVPERFKEVAPRSHRRLMAFFSQHPELRPLMNLRRGLVYEKGESSVRAPGLVMGGEYWVEPNLARILDNHMSKDLIMEESWGRGLMASRNFLNAVQLGLSAFHLSNLTYISAVNRMQVGTSKLLRGDMRGAIDLLKSPLAALDYTRLGMKFYKGGDPSMAKLERDVFMAGAKLGGRLYYNEGAFDNFRAAAQDHGFALAKWGQDPIANLGALLKAVRGNPAHAAFAAVEASSRLMAAYAERLKIGAFREVYSQSLEKHAKALARGEVTREALARQAWANVEDRLGLINYDNEFWNRTLRSVIQLAIRAPGWRLGVIRQILIGPAVDVGRAGVRGAKLLRRRAGAPAPTYDERPELTDRIVFAILALMTQLGIGGLYHYLHTGKRPEKYEDYRHPENGAVDEKGRPIVIDFPTDIHTAEGYLRGVEEIARGYGFGTLGRRFGIAPEASLGWEMLDNRDWKGDYIRTPDAPFDKQFVEVMTHLFGSLQPFSFQQGGELGGRTPKASHRIQGFLGITKSKHPTPPRKTITVPLKEKHKYKAAG